MLSFKKNLFSLKNNAILHNRAILYFIFLLSLGNLFYLSVERDFITIVNFILVGFLTSFFSKNMLIILFVALITSTLLRNTLKTTFEGLDNMEEGAMDGEEVGADDDNDLMDERYLEEDDETPKKKSKSNIEEFEEEQEGEDEEELEDEDEDDDEVEVEGFSFYR